VVGISVTRYPPHPSTPCTWHPSSIVLADIQSCHHGKVNHLSSRPGDHSPRLPRIRTSLRDGVGTDAAGATDNVRSADHSFPRSAGCPGRRALSFAPFLACKTISGPTAKDSSAPFSYRFGCDRKNQSTGARSKFAYQPSQNALFTGDDEGFQAFAPNDEQAGQNAQ
jgi:hypothetical protein